MTNYSKLEMGTKTKISQYFILLY